VVLGTDIEMIREEDREYFQSRASKADAIVADIQSVANADVSDRRISVLEVGANSCFISHRLTSISAWDMHCLEIETDRLLKYPDICRSFKSVLADATAIPFADGTFDLVICNHTLEHVIRYEDCVREMLRVTRNKGYIYLALPNSNRLVDELAISFSTLRTNLSWYFKRVFKASTIENRVKHHVGLADGEIRRAFGSHNVTCLSKGHALRSLSRRVKAIAMRVPVSIFDHFSPVCVYFVEKAAVEK
jgi:SAM-dependent methyltransferase